MAAQDERRTPRPEQRATSLFVRLGPGESYSPPIPTADRLRCVDPGSRLGWVELRYRGELIGFTAAEDDS